MEVNRSEKDPKHISYKQARSLIEETANCTSESSTSGGRSELVNYLSRSGTPMGVLHNINCTIITGAIFSAKSTYSTNIITVKCWRSVQFGLKRILACNHLRFFFKPVQVHGTKMSGLIVSAGKLLNTYMSSAIPGAAFRDHLT